MAPRSVSARILLALAAASNSFCLCAIRDDWHCDDDDCGGIDDDNDSVFSREKSKRLEVKCFPFNLALTAEFTLGFLLCAGGCGCCCVIGGC
jgi:hypothetical protein